MTLRSTARDAYHVALDFWGCIRRFVDGKAVNGYDDHMAEVLADDAGKRAGRDLADALAEGKSRNEYLGPYESPENFAEAIERECDCGTCAAISRDREQRCDEAAERPRVSPPTRASGHPTFPNWCAAEMHQLADILARCDEPFALGYANDLRHAAMEASGDPGQPRVLWPWSNEDERQK